jgi:hypothetical protein
MSTNVNHNVVRIWSGVNTAGDDTGLLAVAGAGVEGADTLTSKWIDTNGWTDRVIAFEVDSTSTIDFDVTMHISSQSAYELNNKTCTTEDYVAVTIVNAHTAAVYKRYDSDDIDELKIPVRATRFVINNDDATATTGVAFWLEGWS